MMISRRRLLGAASAAGLRGFDKAQNPKTVVAELSNKIVVVGSSTAGGSGASRVSNGWVALWQASLAGSGIELVNISIGGHSSADALGRLSGDVFPLKPTDVVLATNIFNDGMAGRRWQPVLDSYVRNTDESIKRIRSFGARAWLQGQYPCSSYQDGQESGLEQLYLYYESRGILLWDCWNTTNDPDRPSDWMPGLSVDGVHPTDLGHRLLFQAIPPGFARQMSSSQLIALKDRLYCSGSWDVDAERQNTDDMPLALIGDINSPSVCVYFDISPTRIGEGTVTLFEDLSNGVRVEMTVGEVRIVVSGRVEWRLPFVPQSNTHYPFAYSYHGPSGRVSVWLNRSELIASDKWIAPFRAVTRVRVLAVSSLGVTRRWAFLVGAIQVLRSPLSRQSMGQLWSASGMIRATDLLLEPSRGRSKGSSILSLGTSQATVDSSARLHLAPAPARSCVL
jgi:lysophospholipase L1-like esterase